MDVSSLGDIDGEGNAVVSRQTLSPCEQHNGTCLRCGEDLVVKPRRKFQGEERRQRKTISIKVPKDAQEDGGKVWDNLIEQCQGKLGEQSPPYFVLTKIMYDWLTQ